MNTRAGGFFAAHVVRRKFSTSLYSFHGSQLFDFFRRTFLPEISGHPINDISEIGLRTETSQGMKFLDGGHPSHHVFKSRLVGLVVRNKPDGGIASRAVLHDFGEILNRDFLRVANIDY